MKLKKGLDHGLNGFHVATIPKAPRSNRVFIVETSIVSFFTIYVCVCLYHCLMLNSVLAWLSLVVLLEKGSSTYEDR